MATPMQMQSAAPQASVGKYNGSVDVQGEPVQVKDGIADFQGEKFFVSANGEMVITKDGQFIGKVEAGKFVQADQKMIDGMVKSGQLRMTQPKPDVESQG